MDASFKFVDNLTLDVISETSLHLSPKTQRRLTSIELDEALQNFEPDSCSTYTDVDILAPYNLNLKLKNSGVTTFYNEPVYLVEGLTITDVCAMDHTFKADINSRAKNELILTLSALVRKLSARYIAVNTNLGVTATNENEYGGDSYGDVAQASPESFSIPDYLPDNIELLLDPETAINPHTQVFPDDSAINIEDKNCIDISFYKKENGVPRRVPLLLTASQLKRFVAAVMYQADKVKDRYVLTLNPIS